MHKDKLNSLPNSWKQGFEVAREARRLSTAPTNGKCLGAALFSGNRLLSLGANIYNKTHSLTKDDLKKSTHAEIIAIIRRRHYEDKRLTLYIWRESISGQPVTSRPCNSCMTAIIVAGIKRIRFINEDNQFVQERII